jgi:hypothetical protein
MFTGIFANYGALNNINNAFMVLFIMSSFFTKKSKVKSKIFYLYGIIALISILNQIFYYTIGEFDFNLHYITVPMIFLLLYAVNRIKLNFTFEDFIIANLILLPIVFLLGGVSEYKGRIQTEYVSATLQGVLIFFGFMVSAQNILRKKNIYISFFVLVASLGFMVMSGSRQNLLFLLVGVFMLIYPIFSKKKYFRSFNLIKKTIIGSILIVAGYFIVSISLTHLSERFGGGIDTMMNKTLGSEQEYSARERASFIETAIEVAGMYPTGVGHGNTKEAIAKYGSPLYKVTHNSHSFVAEMLFTTGYIGIVIWIFIFVTLMKLMFNKQTRFTYGYIPLYFIIATFTTPLIFGKVFWASLVILERQILKNKRVENEKNIINR